MTNLISSINKILGYQVPLKDKTSLIKFLDITNKMYFDKEKFEKDFYLTVILNRIAKAIPEINFKGGTCLNKIYFPYFRLSEDLDFSLCIEDDLVNTNGKRAKFAQLFREKVKELSNIMGRKLNDDKFHHQKAQGNDELKKKEYTYLKYLISYPSIYEIEDQEIKIELNYTAKQYFASVYKPVQSIFIDPILEENIFKEQNIRCLDLQEMTTEKCRACLTRRKPAIRDFFDLRYLQSQGIDILANKEIIKAKCDEVSDRDRTLYGYYAELEKQIQTHLLPVTNNLYDFDLKDIYKKMLNLQRELFE